MTGSATALAACKDPGNNGHQHVYEWTWEGTEEGDEHWKACKEDGVEEEGTRGLHVFVAGECECGAEQTVVEKKYGSATGQIKLHKNGGYEDDYTGVTLDIGDDDVTKSVDATGKFTLENLEVGKSYSLVISKPGYARYSLTVKVNTEGQTVTVGGSRGCVLEYKVFGMLAGWDEDLHDVSHVNDDEPYLRFKENSGSKSLNVITQDGYTDVSATYRVKFNNSGHANWHLQGLAFKFEDGKHLVARFHTDSIQIADAQWDNENVLKKADSLFGGDANLNEWGENWLHRLTDAEMTAIKADGLDLTAVLENGVFYLLFDGKFLYKYALPEGYANKKAQIAYYCYDAVGGAIFDYEITETLPTLESTVDIAIDQPEGAGCTVVKDPVKDKYAYGEQIKLKIATAGEHALDELLVNGVDMYDSVVDGELTVTADRPTVNVSAKFVKEEPIALELAVKGKKLGKTAALADGTQVRFSGITEPFTVTDGKIKSAADAKVKTGRYTVSADGYLDATVRFDRRLNEIVLERDTFKEILGWGQFDFTNQNADTPKFGITNDCAVILTKDTYGSGVMASIYLKGNNMNAGNGGLVFRFVGDGMAANGESITILMQGTKKVQVAKDALWDKTTIAGGVEWSNLIYFVEGEDDNAYRYADEHAEEYLADYAKGELKLSVLREESTFYVFLNGRYVGKHTIDDKYKTARCEVGFMSGNLGNNADWKYWNVAIDENVQRDAVTVNDGTADNANGNISFSQSVKVGDTVSVTVTPDRGYLIDKLTVKDGDGNDVDCPYADGKYTFVAKKTAYTVTGTFKEAPQNEATASVSGIGLGNTPVDMKGKELKFVNELGTTTTLTVNNTGSVTGALAPGEYTVKVDGFYDLTVTVGDDGLFTGLTDGLKFEKVILAFNKINEPANNLAQGGFLGNVADSTHVASAGKIVNSNTLDAGSMYEWTEEEYDDVAMSVTIKKQAGDQGLIVKFYNVSIYNRSQQDVRVRIQEYDEEDSNGQPTGKKLNKIQWMASGWFWGTHHAIDKWDFMDKGGSNYAVPLSDALVQKYTGTGLKLTLARKGSMVYVLIDGEIYSAQMLDDRFDDQKVRVAFFANSVAKNYEVPVEITTDVDALLAGKTDSHGFMGVLGKWTVTDTTLAVTGNGYAEFAPAIAGTKESLSVTLKDGSSTAGKKAQGVLYRFADGHWLAARMETSSDGTYIQWADDAILPKLGGTLAGWAKIKDFSPSDLTNGVALKMVRDGKNIYVLLGNEVIDIKTLDDKYATMEGVMATTIEHGTGNAFAYEYKSGDDVVMPTVYTASASISGEAHGYTVSVDKGIVKPGESVTVTV